jgi:tripartite-type tricarboxylate transporter receptor subunit TctC
MAGRRHTVGAIAVAFALFGTAEALAQSSATYPSKPVKIVVPVTPGSPVDALVRVVAQHLHPHLGQSIIVENRPGGGLSIGAKAAAAADPDGYTLLSLNNGHFFGLTPNAGYDPVKSFAPVATIAEWSHVLVVRADLPAKTVQDLIAYAKANPGKVTFGFGVSTPPHILGETFKNTTGVSIASVPYRGGAQAVTDMLGGRIDMNFGTTATLLPLIEQGKVRALAYTGTSRSRDLPDVPTMSESGLPQLTFNPDNWSAIAAPARTPRDVIDTLRIAIARTLDSDDLKAAFARLGFNVMVTPQKHLESFIAAEAQKWPPIVKAAGLTLE